jgi:hypothetical protein
LTNEALEDPNLVPLAEGQTVAELILTGQMFQHLHEEHLADLQRFITVSS